MTTRSVLPEAKPPKILLADDDATALRSMSQSLARREPSFIQFTANSAAEALSIAAKERPDAAVVDLSIDPAIGPESGLALISQLGELDPTMRILVLTGHGSDEYGIRALQQGAASFMVKPAEIAHLIALLKDAVNYAQLKRSFFRVTEVSERLTALTGLSTRSPAMEPVLEAVAYAASNRQPVLLIGETGVGKGIIAQAIHRSSSKPTAPFIRFQPRFGTADLVSSELFGHEKGAFTGALEQRRGLVEEANGGTLFLDEVDELPLETQVLLLNVLQEKIFRRVGSNRDLKSDFRLISATNRPIKKSLHENKLREDFYHRIAHCVVEIPPLRERIEDISQLANFFLTQLVNREKLAVHGIASDALHKLERHNWPGNVRELQATVEGGVYRANFHERRYVELSDLTLKNAKESESTSGRSFREQVEQYELDLIRDAMAKSGGNQSKAAELLQLDRSTLRRILQR